MFDHTQHKRIFIAADTFQIANRCAHKHKIPFVKWDHLTRPVMLQGLDNPCVLLPDETIVSTDMERMWLERNAQVYLENGEIYD